MRNLILILAIIFSSCSDDSIDQIEDVTELQVKETVLPIRIIVLKAINQVNKNYATDIIESLDRDFKKTNIDFQLVELIHIDDKKRYNSEVDLINSFRKILETYNVDYAITIVVRDNKFAPGIAGGNIISIGDRYLKTTIPSHEMGHLLGLNHQEVGLNIMNQIYNYENGEFTSDQIDIMETKAKTRI